MSSSSRQRLIDMISQKIGFSLGEEDLSPRLRGEIGQLAKEIEEYDRLVSVGRNLREAASFGLVLGLILIVIGFLVLWFCIAYSRVLHGLWIVAVPFVLLSFPFWAFYGIKKSKGGYMESKAQSFWLDLDDKAKLLSKRIQSELSQIHEAKVRPTVKHLVIDFAGILQAAKGRGIVLTSIECPHCNGVVEVPSTGEYFECQHCGRKVHATNIFDKLRDILSPT